MKSKTKYTVSYYTLEPSYYDHSERNYTTKVFTKKKEALEFAEEAKKQWPAQITLTRTTEQTILRLCDTDRYKENRAND